MNRPIDQYKRVQAMKYHAPTQVNTRREDGYQPPAPVWVQWSVMIPASLLATYAVIEFALHVLPVIQNFVRSIP